MKQLDLFPVELRFIKLYAKSAKNAWWQLRLLDHNGKYYIEKQSGIPAKILDRRCWPQKNLETALKTYTRKVNQKLNPYRNSPRIYQLTCCND